MCGRRAVEPSVLYALIGVRLAVDMNPRKNTVRMMERNECVNGLLF